MKGIIFQKCMIIVAIITALTMISCARVSLGLDKEGDIKFDSAGGYTGPERGLSIRAQNARTRSMEKLYRKYDEAIAKDDYALASVILKQIQHSRAAINTAFVRINNDTKFFITGIQDEFAGVKVPPFSRSSVTREVACGEYALTFRFYNQQSRKPGTMTKYFLVSAGDTYITISKGSIKSRKRRR